MSWYVGLDPASEYAGAAAIDEQGRLAHRAIRARGQVPKRLATLRRDSREFLGELAEHGVWCVVVERPDAHHGGPTLLAAYGVMVEVAAATLEAPVLTLTPAEVDEAVFGRPPRQPRSAPRPRRKPRLMRHARGLGYDGDSQDVADALCCAAAARALTLRKLGTEAAA